MAIWQFRLDFIPEKTIRDEFGVLPVTIPASRAEESQWWSSVQPPTGFEAWIDDILPNAKSWSESMRIWGDERGDTASVCYNDNARRRVDWIGFRVDVRQLSPVFVKDICDLAGRLGCMLLTGDYHLLVPNDAEVLAAVSNSTANKYLQDPVSTLSALKQSTGEIVPLPAKTPGKRVKP